MKKILSSNKGFVSVLATVFFINMTILMMAILFKCYSGYYILNNIKDFNKSFEIEINNILLIKKKYLKDRMDEDLIIEFNDLKYKIIIRNGEILDYWIV